MEELKKEFLEYRKEFGLTKMMRIVFQRSHEDFIQRCKDFVDSVEWVNDINELFKMFEYNIVLPKCIICGKTISFHSYDVAHNHNLRKPPIKPLLTCSKECRYSDEMVKIWKDKMAKTNLERYGVAETLSLKEMHDKAKETIREKYGVDNASKSDVIKKKKEDTFIKHYGVNNIFAAEEGKNKIKQTLMERYGVENVAHCAEVREKIRETCMKKYGGTSYLTGNEYLKEFWKNSFNEYKKELEDDWIECLFGEEDYKGVLTTENNRRVPIKYDFKCKECGEIFQGTFVGNLPRCPICNNIRSGRSSIEEEILNFVEKLPNTKIESNDRKLLGGLELDILDTNNKIAIEVNGLYWHTEEKGKDKFYHLNKTKNCAKNNIQLIHIFEDEWKERKNTIKWKLKDIFKVEKRKIYSDNCIIKEVDNNLAQRFLEKYHIKGKCVSSINLGLFYKNHLIAVACFCKSRFNKMYNWELLRFASIFSFEIVDGFKCLLSFFDKKYDGSIIAYRDRRWESLDYFNDSGFTKIKDLPPVYYYTRGTKRYSRTNFQKHLLINLLPFFDENLSEEENMTINGYYKIWDCGKEMWLKNKSEL